MKGHEHYQRAERLVNHAEHRRDITRQERADLLAAAQVHSMLAAAVALSNIVKLLAFATDDDGLDDAEPTRAEPLVTCPATAEDGDVLCELPVDHDGPHEGATFSWSTDAELAAITPESALPGLCGCGHIEARHAPHMYGLASQPRGVCLSGCGCLAFEPESAPELVPPMDVVVNADGSYWDEPVVNADGSFA